MALWQKLWLLFAVIWLIVSALNAGTILAFGEEPGKALQPAVYGIVVPAIAYLALWAWVWAKRRRRRARR
jgi:O-antigen/teichoic acid export membrane protein